MITNFLKGRLLSTKAMSRAIGVIYLPETERTSHYFHARLTDQFVVVAHFDEYAGGGAARA